MQPLFAPDLDAHLDAAAAPASSVARWSNGDGLTLSLHPWPIDDAQGSPSLGGPRGLIRIGQALRGGDAFARLLNFVAIEPVTHDGRRGFSELEASPGDGRPGLRFWCDATELRGQSLRLRIRTERFANGAHPYLIAQLSSRRPGEVRFEVYAHDDSAPIKMCVLSATMGNLQRLRTLRLKDRTVHVRDVLPDEYDDWGFTPHASFPLSDFIRDGSPRGGALIEAQGDESDEIDAREGSRGLPSNWAYEGENWVRYWRQPAPLDAELRAVVNARRAYWKRDTLIPGGKSFENFELNAPFRQGQSFVFGLRPA